MKRSTARLPDSMLTLRSRVFRLEIPTLNAHSMQIQCKINANSIQIQFTFNANINTMQCKFNENSMRTQCTFNENAMQIRCKFDVNPIKFNTYSMQIQYTFNSNSMQMSNLTNCQIGILTQSDPFVNTQQPKSRYILSWWGLFEAR